MEIIGATYYPSDIEKSLSNESEILKRLNTSSSTKNKEIFDSFKKELLGNGYFIASGDLKVKTDALVEEIQSGSYDESCAFYDPISIYQLANSINYVVNVKSGSEKKNMANLLTRTMAHLANDGANLEETKALILFDNLKKINNIDSRYFYAELDEDFCKNAQETVEILNQFDNNSPYVSLYERSYNYLMQKDRDRSTEMGISIKMDIVDSYDPVMVKSYAYNLALSSVLSLLLFLRKQIFINADMSKISSLDMIAPEIKTLGLVPIRFRVYKKDFMDKIEKFMNSESEANMKELFSIFQILNKVISEYDKNWDYREALCVFGSANLLHSFGCSGLRLSTYKNINNNSEDEDGNSL